MHILHRGDGRVEVQSILGYRTDRCPRATHASRRDKPRGEDDWRFHLRDPLCREESMASGSRGVQQEEFDLHL